MTMQCVRWMSSAVLFLCLTFLPATALADTVLFNSDTTIAEGDLTYEGSNIVVQGCVVTVQGDHAFGAVVAT